MVFTSHGYASCLWKEDITIIFLPSDPIHLPPQAFGLQIASINSYCIFQFSATLCSSYTLPSSGSLLQSMGSQCHILKEKKKKQL